MLRHAERKSVTFPRQRKEIAVHFFAPRARLWYFSASKISDAFIPCYLMSYLIRWAAMKSILLKALYIANPTRTSAPESSIPLCLISTTIFHQEFIHFRIKQLTRKVQAQLIPYWKELPYCGKSLRILRIVIVRGKRCVALTSNGDKVC